VERDVWTVGCVRIDEQIQRYRPVRIAPQLALPIVIRVRRRGDLGGEERVLGGCGVAVGGQFVV